MAKFFLSRCVEMWGSGSFQCVYILWINRAINCYRKEKRSVKIKAEAQTAVAWLWEENGVQGEIWESNALYCRGRWKCHRISWEILRRARLKKSHWQKGRLSPEFQIHVSFGDVICNTLQFFHMWFSLCQFLSSQLSSLLYPFIISCILSSFPIFSSSCPLPFGPSLWDLIHSCLQWNSSEMLH